MAKSRSDDAASVGRAYRRDKRAGFMPGKRSRFHLDERIRRNPDEQLAAILNEASCCRSGFSRELFPQADAQVIEADLKTWVRSPKRTGRARG